VSSRTCPDWPELMEPVEALTKVSHVSLGDVAICCDREHHVYYAAHTDPQVVAALAGTHWYEVQEYAERGPGSSPAAA
jgi:hypothetical protein